MSPAIMSACLLSGLTRLLSPAELRARPEPGTLAYGLFAVRAASTVREGMLEKEAEAVLGRVSDMAARLFRHMGVYEDLGLRVTFTYTPVAGKVVLESRVKEVRFFSVPAMRPRAARPRTRSLEEAMR
jgi:hypothetical protein